MKSSEYVRISEVYSSLNAECSKPGGGADLARRAGVTRQAVNQMLYAKIPPTGSVLAALGFRSVTVYERIK